MIYHALAFVLGVLFASCAPESFQAWVRGAAGKAREFVLGAAPARQPDISTASYKRQSAEKADNRLVNEVIKPDIQPDISRASDHSEHLSQSDHTRSGITSEYTQSGITEVSPPRPKNPIRAGTALKNVAGFFIGLIAWVAKNPIPAIALLVLALWLMAGASCSGPFGFGKSQGELRLEREIAEREARFQETLRARDEAVAEIRIETARTLEQIRIQSQRGQDAIAAATPEHEDPIDPDLVAAWRDALDGLCVPRANGDRADTCRS